MGDGRINKNIFTYLDMSKRTQNCKSTRCTCGKNSKREHAEAIHCGGNQQTTRCPCVANANMCSRECKCKGCQNKKDNNTVQSTYKVVSCSCGKTKKKSNPRYKSCIDVERKSKCRCLKNGVKCTNACDCYNCYNRAANLPVIMQCGKTKGEKRKRVNPCTYKRSKSTKYLQNEMAQEPLQGTWTHLETFVLVNILSLLSTLTLSPSINDITKLFNFIADCDSKREKQNNQTNIRKKSTSQVNGKVIHIQDVQEASESLQKSPE